MSFQKAQFSKTCPILFFLIKSCGLRKFIIHQVLQPTTPHPTPTRLPKKKFYYFFAKKKIFPSIFLEFRLYF